jgi:hypothetical protein
MLRLGKSHRKKNDAELSRMIGHKQEKKKTQNKNTIGSMTKKNKKS